MYVLHTAAQFTVVPRKPIVYMCVASQTPSLRTKRAPFHQICEVNNL